MNELTTVLAILPDGRVATMQVDNLILNPQRQSIDVTQFEDTYRRSVPGQTRTHLSGEVIGEFSIVKGPPANVVMAWAAERMVRDACESLTAAVMQRRDGLISELMTQQDMSVNEIDTARVKAIKLLHTAGKKGRRFVAREAFAATGKPVAKKAPAKKATKKRTVKRGSK